jgi:hypothetical protein
LQEPVLYLSALAAKGVFGIELFRRTRSEAMTNQGDLLQEKRIVPFKMEAKRSLSIGWIELHM